MDNVLKSLLESDALDDSLKQDLQENWENALNEAREQVREEVEVSLREEFGRRYESDREKMVDAMDNFMTEALEKELTEFAEDRKQVYETRTKLARQIQENKEQHEGTVKGTVKVLEAFVLKMINKELKEFMEDKRALAEAKKANAVKLTESKQALNVVTASRINKLEKFVVKKLSEEINEFETDKQELIEQKVRMARNAKAKLDETRKAFVTRSAALVEKTLRESLTKEFTQFRDDIKGARENHFGRKIFEAFAAEYMTSYLSEGSEVRKLQTKLGESTGQTARAINQLKDQQDVIRGLDRKVKVIEDKSIREKTLHELLSPLGKENRAVMEEILTSVKTGRLREAFQKQLPSVLNESRSSVGARKSLAEAKVTRRTVARTGNRTTRVAQKLTEANDVSDIAGMTRLQALAGIK